MKASSVQHKSELEDILSLQQKNLRGKFSASIENEQGFLTVAHSLNTLQKMHELEPSIIVKKGDSLAGFALVMPTSCRNLVPELFAMFNGLEKIDYQGKLIYNYNFYVMGQVCVAREYRGMGVFDLLYQKHREVFSNKYDFVLTEISTRNTRSLRAHERVGFKQIALLNDDLDEWSVVVWDWK